MHEDKDKTELTCPPRVLQLSGRVYLVLRMEDGLKALIDPRIINAVHDNSYGKAVVFGPFGEMSIYATIHTTDEVLSAMRQADHLLRE